MPGDALDERRARVDADITDSLGVTTMPGRVIGERGDGLGAPALGRERRLGPVDIDKQRDVVVTALGGGFVDGNSRGRRGVSLRRRLLDVVVVDDRHHRVWCSPTIRATALTGIAETMVMSSASNSRVKPLSGLAHGTLGCLMPHRSQRTWAFRYAWCSKKVEVMPGYRPLGVAGWAVRRVPWPTGRQKTSPNWSLTIGEIRLVRWWSAIGSSCRQ